MNPLALAPTSLPEAPPLEYIEAAAHAGYRLIGLRLNRSPGFPFHPVAGNPDLVRNVKRALGNAGMSVLDVLSFYLQPATRIEEFLPAFELAAEIGAKYTLVIGDDPEWDRMRERFGELCDATARFGLSAALEFAVMRPLGTLQLATRLIDEVGRPNAVVCVDPVNLLRGSGGPELLKALDGKLMPYAQISDGLLGPGEPDLARARQNGPSERRLPGQGTLPLAAFLDALPPGIPLSVEVPTLPGERVAAPEWARATLQGTRRYLEQHYATRA